MDTKFHYNVGHLAGLAALAALLIIGMLDARPRIAAGRAPDDVARVSQERCVTPPDDMVAWLTFDELGVIKVVTTNIAGTLVTAFRDHAGANNYGVPTGSMGAMPPTTGVGMVDGAVVLNGKDQFVQVAAHPELDFGMGDFSIDAWVHTDKPEDLKGFRPIVDKMAPGPTDMPFGYTFFIEDRHLGFRIAGNDGSSVSAISKAEVKTGWQFVAVTVKRGTGADGVLYVNDEAETFDMSPFKDTADTPSDLIIGSRNRFSPLPVTEFFQGAIDELELYSSAHNDGELAAIYKAGAAGKCKPWLQPSWQVCSNGGKGPNCLAHDEMVNIDVANGCRSAANGFQFVIDGIQSFFQSSVSSTNYPILGTYEVECPPQGLPDRCNPFTPAHAKPVYDNAVNVKTITVRWKGDGMTQISPNPLPRPTCPTLRLHLGRARCQALGFGAVATSRHGRKPSLHFVQLVYGLGFRCHQFNGRRSYANQRDGWLHQGRRLGILKSQLLGIGRARFNPPADREEYCPRSQARHQRRSETT